MNIIKVRNLKKTFGDREILKDISFDINENEVVSIIGYQVQVNQLYLDV